MPGTFTLKGIALITAAVLILLAVPAPARGLERLCDPAHEDCRAPLLNLIEQETAGIDVAFWFMEDTRYASALIRAHKRGVPIRVLMDSRANPDYPINAVSLQMLQDAGIPMRQKKGGGILHWKMMLFAGQQTVQFSGANYSDEAFVPIVPWRNYVDEVIYFTDRAGYVQSFMTKYDDVWTDALGYENYANVTSVHRVYSTFPIHPELNFPPGGFRERSLASYTGETQRIDALMYRITDRTHTDTLIEVASRGVPVRIVTEQLQYRDESRLWHAWNVDRLWAAGQAGRIAGQPSIHIRHRRHQGLSHEKLTVLRGQGMAILGSSNWTSPSSDTQLEHNLFTVDPVIYSWSADHFDRKWFNRGGAAETQPFAPLPPQVPLVLSPAPGASDLPTTVTLMWRPGPWAHRYDVYLGTDPANMTKVVDDEEMGPYDRAWEAKSLAPGVTYFWRVVSRTMAGLSRSGPICSFRTAGAGGAASPICLAAPPDPPDPVAADEPQDIGAPPPAPAPPPPPPPAPPTTPPSQPAPPAESSPSSPMVPISNGTTPARTRTPGATYTGTVAVPRR